MIEPDEDDELEGQPTHQVHGCRREPESQHPLLDIRHWRDQFPLGDNREEVHFINGPAHIALAEQAREVAARHGPLGPAVPSDVFVWSHAFDRERPWLTQLGGRPWRERDRAWPMNASGEPLAFLGQICLVDSADALAVPLKELPGEIVQFFACYEEGNAPSGADAAIEVEWSNVRLKNPPGMFDRSPRRAELPFCYQGARHRTVQHTAAETYSPTFEKAGFKDGGHTIAQVQATCIGARASLPQGWPWEGDFSERLICVLSSFYFRHEWPLCDAPTGELYVDEHGQSYSWHGESTLSLGIGDVGCIYVYRDADGRVGHEYLP